MTLKPFIHDDAVVDSKNIGSGTRIWRNAHILSGAVIGERCNIGENCYIESHVTIGNGVTVKNNVAVWDNITIADDVFIGPAAVFTNDLWPRAQNKKNFQELQGIVVKKGATIGANATIVCGITIYEYAFIGAGSVVTKDVPAYTVVYGNPAAARGLICACACSLPVQNGRCTCSCGLRYEIEGATVRLVV